MRRDDPSSRSLLACDLGDLQDDVVIGLCVLVRVLVLDDDQANATSMMFRVIGHDNCEWTTELP
jgi:hypothetical protein